MNDRKAYHHARVLWDGGVISTCAAHCHEFGKNPDVDELERYNIAAKSRGCNHAKLQFHDNGESAYYVCGGCDLSDPDWREKFKACRVCWWKRDPNCKHCHGVGLIPIGEG